MTRQFLYIVDELSTLNVKTDTTLAIMDEANRRGVKNFACEISDISLLDGELRFNCAQVEVTRDDNAAPHYLEKKSLRVSDEFRVIFMRKDPPVDEKFLSALFMLRCYRPQNTLVLNNPDGILCANEKLLGQKIAADFFPKTLVTSDLDLVKDFAKTHEHIVVKPLFQAGGSGVMAFHKGDRNLSSAVELLTRSFTTPLIAQAYIKNARDGDKRVIILGGEAKGAILRVPAEHDHRANIHAGGCAQASSLNARDYEIVAALRPHLLELGLHFVGIDVIGGFLTEINVTSPTCVKEIESMSQKPHEKPLRSEILDYVEGLIA